MTEGIHDDVDVIRTGYDDEGELDPDIGGIDYLAGQGEDSEDYGLGIDKVEDEGSTEIWGLEPGNYEMDSIELDRTLRSMSHRAFAANAEDYDVLLMDTNTDTYCAVEVEDLDVSQTVAEVSVEQGDLSELELDYEDDVVENQNTEVSEPSIQASGSAFNGFVQRAEVDPELENMRKSPDQISTSGV